MLATLMSSVSPSSLTRSDVLLSVGQEGLRGRHAHVHVIPLLDHAGTHHVPGSASKSASYVASL